MKSNYLLLHGSFGSPFVNWFPYLRKKIEEKGLEVYSPVFLQVLDIKPMITGLNF